MTFLLNFSEHLGRVATHAAIALLLFLVGSEISLARTLIVTAPDTCENGAICPVTVSSSLPLTAGTVLGVAVNGTDAVKVAVLEGSLGEFSTRLILDANGRSQVTAYCVGCSTGEKRINVGSSRALNSAVSYPRGIRVRSTPDDFRVLVDSGGDPPGHGHAILDATKLKVAVQLTPRISANPYFGFRGDVGPGNPCFGITTSQSLHQCVADSRALSMPWTRVAQSFTQDVVESSSTASGNAIVRERHSLASQPSASDTNTASKSLSVAVTEPDANGLITLTVAAPANIASLKINGDEEGGRADGRYSVRRFAQVGENRFEVVATDRFGNTQRQTVSVVRQAADTSVRFAALNPTNVRARPATDAVAIIIGIQDYRRVPKAEFANNDARLFYDYAIRGLGVRPENIKLLLDQQADDIEILAALQNWLPLKSKKGQTDVYVFYSGHGLPSDDGSTLYLLPHGVDRQFLDRTAIKQAELVSALQAVKPKSVTVFLDACYSGQIRTGETLLASARPIALQPKATSFPANFTVISASAPDQIASSSPELKHGVFSYFLMKGMEGDADLNKDGRITVSEMQSYLSDSVGRKAMSLSRTQQPQVVGDQTRVLIAK